MSTCKDSRRRLVDYAKRELCTPRFSWWRVDGKCPWQSSPGDGELECEPWFRPRQLAAWWGCVVDWPWDLLRSTLLTLAGWTSHGLLGSFSKVDFFFGFFPGLWKTAIMAFFCSLLSLMNSHGTCCQRSYELFYWPWRSSCQVWYGEECMSCSTYLSIIPKAF